MAEKNVVAEVIDVASIIGDAALLEQTAEECVELAHACLKMARIIRKENPTPAAYEEMMAKIEEETADVYICLEQLEVAELLNYTGVDSMIMEKYERLVERLTDEAKMKLN